MVVVQLYLMVMVSVPSQVVFLSFLSTKWLWCFLPEAFSAPHFCLPLRYRNQGPLWLCSVQCTASSFSRLRESGCLLYTPATTSSVLHGRAPRVSGIRQGWKDKAWGGAQGLSHLCSSEIAGCYSSKSARRSNQSILKEIILGVHWKDWCWSWNSNILATWCEELTHWKRPWCWERLKAGGGGDDRGWDGWMASPTQWTWVWVDSGSWWWTGRPGVLRLMGSQRVGHNWATELNSSRFYLSNVGWCEPPGAEIWELILESVGNSSVLSVFSWLCSCPCPLF